mgnify:FL=1
MNNGPSFSERKDRSEAWKLLNRVDYNELTMEELDTMASVILQAQKRLGKSTVNTLKIGDTVTWMSGRTRGKFANMKLTGQVIKINQVRVKVRSGRNGVWSVPGTMLTKVS